ncbi:MAG TPA: hypothetical protein VID93_00820, partial [Acidimicrobiales bacterium]
MPIGYLVTVLLVGCVTAFAVARPRAGRLGLSFRLGYPVNELPFLAGFCLVAATVLASVQGDLDSPIGWLAFGMAIVTTVGLAVIAKRGWRAGPVIERAMDDGLGADWRSAIDTELAARLRRRRPWARIVLWPFPLFDRGVERVADIRY